MSRAWDSGRALISSFSIELAQRRWPASSGRSCLHNDFHLFLAPALAAVAAASLNSIPLLLHLILAFHTHGTEPAVVDQENAVTVLSQSKSSVPRRQLSFTLFCVDASSVVLLLVDAFALCDEAVVSKSSCVRSSPFASIIYAHACTAQRHLRLSFDRQRGSPSVFQANKIRLILFVCAQA
jgi:hypothetical protein